MKLFLILFIIWIWLVSVILRFVKVADSDDNIWENLDDIDT